MTFRPTRRARREVLDIWWRIADDSEPAADRFGQASPLPKVQTAELGHEVCWGGQAEEGREEEGEATMRRNFVAGIHEGTDARYINLDLVRLVDEIRPGHCRLWFSETHSVAVNGEGAALLMARISDRTMNFDGTDLHVGNENIASLKSRSPSGEIDPKPSPES